MLTKLVKEHQYRTNRLKEENEMKKKAAFVAVNNMTTEMLDTVNAGAADVFSNQKKIDAESRNLQAQTQKFSKQTSQWLSLVANFNESLKEIGDIENWAKSIENEMVLISKTLDDCAKQSQNVNNPVTTPSTEPLPTPDL